MSFLDRLLRGTPPATADETDRLTVRQLRGAGADLSKPRRVLHFLELPSGASVDAAVAALERAGYETTVTRPDETTFHWSVRAEASRVVDETTVPAFRAWFEQLAHELGGEYEGWEAWPKP